MNKYTKITANGNDFILIDKDERFNPIICDRHFGIGSDGIILFSNSEIADCKIEVLDSNGNPTFASANSIICSAKYYTEYIKNSKCSVKIECENKVNEAIYNYDNGFGATLDLGMASLDADSCKITKKINIIYDYKLTLQNGIVEITCVMMKVPQVIIFTFDLENIDLKNRAKQIQQNSLFSIIPYVNFVKLKNHSSISIRSFSPNGTEILSSGESACAAVFSCMHHFNTPGDVIVQNIKGTSRVFYDESSHHFMFTNTANIISSGMFTYESPVDFTFN